jgi:hypothetical protein
MVADIFRDGNVLVLHKDAILPDRCIKTNAVSSRREEHTLWWHPPWACLLFVLGLSQLAMALKVSKQVTIMIPLSDEWSDKCRRVALIAWSLALAGLAMFVSGLALVLLQSCDWLAPILTIGAIPTALAGGIYAVIGHRLAWAKRISDGYVWIKGACPEFLAQFPPWPYRE